MFSSLGKGMFANVVRARVLHGELGDAGKEVAIKIVRHQESMYVLLLMLFVGSRLTVHTGTELALKRCRYSINSSKLTRTTGSISYV